MLVFISSQDDATPIIYFMLDAVKLYLSVCLNAKQTDVNLCWSCKRNRGSDWSRSGKASSTPGPSYCIVPSVKKQRKLLNKL